MICDLKLGLVVPVGCSPGGMGLRKRGNSERWFARSLQYGDQLWPQDPRNI